MNLDSPRDPTTPAALVLGCMNFGKRTPAAEARRIIDRSLDAGVTWLDTANVYGDGASERIVGDAARNRAFIATKVGLARGDDLSRANVLAACDASLGRLGIETIDLYYLHAPSAGTPPEETLAALQTLLEAGKIRRWGVSNHASWQIAQLRALAASAGMPGPAVSQVLYNAVVRQLDIEYFKYVARFPIHTTVYNPLAGGLLARPPAAPGENPPPGSRLTNPLYRRRYWRASLFDAVASLREVAAEAGISPVALAYAFVVGAPGVDSVLIGPATVAQLDDALAARAIVLTAEVPAKLLGIYQELVGTDASYAR